ncbi:MAG: N,N-dimethylformamidase beta subunit family domain-containing protein [Acidimicrobiales bacterium]
MTTGIVGGLLLLLATVVGCGGSNTTAKRNTHSSHTVGGSRRSRGSSIYGGAGARTFLGPNGVESASVIAENRRSGTTAWEISGGGGSGYIEGFADLNYATVGENVALYVSTTAPSFRVVAYRMGWYQGAGARQIWSSPVETGQVQPPCPLSPATNMVSCDNWSRSLAVPITAAFVSGDYLLKLIGNSGQQGYVPVTIWDPSSHATYLVMARSFTEQAWNTYGGYSFYQGRGPCPPGSNTYPVCNRARVVSFDRPYSDGNGASDFLSNEYPIVRFAEENGLDVTYCTDLTVQENPATLLQHRVLFSLGHDEAWSYGEREAAQTALGKGVNMIFFGAASVLRHVRLQASPLGLDREEVDYRDSAEDPLNGKGDPMEVTGNTWSSPPSSWPESGFVGQIYAGYLEPRSPAASFVVWDASAWIFKGTGLHDGSTVPNLIASDIDHIDPSQQMPRDLQVLGHSPVPLKDTYTNQGKWGQYTYSDMTYYTDPTSKGGVFDSGNNNWINSLTPCPGDGAQCPAGPVARMTGNLLSLFGQGPAGAILPSVANWQAVTPAGS